MCRLLQEGRKVLWHWEESPGQPFFWLFDDGTVKGITGDQAAAVSILDRETIQLLSSGLCVLKSLHWFMCTVSSICWHIVGALKRRMAAISLDQNLCRYRKRARTVSVTPMSVAVMRVDRHLMASWLLVQELLCGSLCYLVDGTVPFSSIHNKPDLAIVAHSPNHNRYKAFMRQVPGIFSAPVYLPPWTLDELYELLALHPSLKKEQVRIPVRAMKTALT